MIEQINQLIELNLQLLFVSERKAMTLVEFRNNQGKPLPGAKMLAEVMQQKDLIKSVANSDFTYELTALGRYVCENGGWLKHSENIAKINKEDLPKSSSVTNNRRKLRKQIWIAGILIALLSIAIVSCI